MVSALLEFAFVVLLNRNPSRLEKNIHDGNAEKGRYHNVDRLFRRRITSKESSTSDELEMKNEQLKDPQNIKTISVIPPIHVVDLYSFCIYIFLFISFNGIYWLNYYV